MSNMCLVSQSSRGNFIPGELYVGGTLCRGNFMLGELYSGGTLCWGNFFQGELYSGGNFMCQPNKQIKVFGHSAIPGGQFMH